MYHSERTRIIQTPSNLNTWGFITDRLLNIRRRFGYESTVNRTIYTALDAHPADTPLQKYYGDQGAIFNLEFNTDGRYVAAACEKKSVLLFDSGNQKQIHLLRDVHSHCVNNVRFLDDTTLATCSDDSIIKLWDRRKFTEPTRILLGRSHWVKDMEYIEDGKLLITSSLDGSIYVWDLQDRTERSIYHENILLLHGITRAKLTPDRTKLILCTTGGYIIIVHDLNILRLCTELRSFRPNVYRLMQSSGQTYPCSTMYSHLFSQKRPYNRLEFVDDFPDESEMITSMQIHPMGWCALSRNVNCEESREWTTVHDIQTRDPSEYANAYIYVEDIVDPNEEPERTMLRPTDIWIGFSSHQNVSYYRSLNAAYPIEGANSSMGIINSGLIGFNVYNRQFRNRPEDKNRIVMTIPRLTHYKSEQLVAKGYIKEVSFSKDGRVICSPYNKGIRLLGFNEKVEELCYCVPEVAQELHEISVMDNYHADHVLSSKFSPVHYQLVTGCSSGEIVWYKPLL